MTKKWRRHRDLNIGEIMETYGLKSPFQITSEMVLDSEGFLGPWTLDLEMPDGDVKRFGYEAPADIEYPDRWDSEHLAHQEIEDDCWNLEGRVNRAIAKSMAEEGITLPSFESGDAYRWLRRERLSSILRWLASAKVGLIARHKRTFWRRVVASRQQCSSTGEWYKVYLTKAQVDVVFAAIEYRLGGGSV